MRKHENESNRKQNSHLVEWCLFARKGKTVYFFSANLSFSNLRAISLDKVIIVLLNDGGFEEKQYIWGGGDPYEWVDPVSTSRPSSTDKQHICINMQLKSSKKQLKLNACVPKSNSFERHIIFTCHVIAYNLVHFFSIWVIHKCQSGIDFFTSVPAVKLHFYE